MAAKKNRGTGGMVQIKPLTINKELNMHRMFGGFMNSKIASDFTITARGKDFPGHRIILAAQSAFFKHAFCENESLLSLSFDCPQEAMEIFLQFLYKGQVDECPVDICEELAELARKLGVPELERQCWGIVLGRRSATHDNCLSSWGLALSLRDRNLISKFEPMCLQGFQILRKHPSFLTMDLASVRKYLSHKHLKANDADQRLRAAMNWLRAEGSDERIQGFPSLLKSLPLRQMTKDTLRNTASEGALMNGFAAARTILYKAANIPLSEEDALKIQYPVFLWVSSRKLQVYSTDCEVKKKVVALPEAESFSSMVACCAMDKKLYVSGLGEDRRGVSCYDIKSDSWQALGELEHSRKLHCMSVRGGKLLTLAGCSPKATYTRCTMVTPVEAFDASINQWTVVGDLNGSGCWRSCCAACGNNDVIVIGALHKYYTEQKSILQVFSTKTNSVSHSVIFPDTLRGWPCGLVVSDDHVIFSLGFDIYTCPLTSLYRDIPDGIQRLDAYDPVNSWAHLMMTEDRETLILVGGYDTLNTMYQASVSDVIANNSQGWKAVAVSWTDQYRCYPGAVCSVVLPSPVDCLS